MDFLGVDIVVWCVCACVWAACAGVWVGAFQRRRESRARPRQVHAFSANGGTTSAPQQWDAVFSALQRSIADEFDVLERLVMIRETWRRNRERGLRELRGPGCVFSAMMPLPPSEASFDFDLSVIPALAPEMVERIDFTLAARMTRDGAARFVVCEGAEIERFPDALSRELVADFARSIVRATAIPAEHLGPARILDPIDELERTLRINGGNFFVVERVEPLKVTLSQTDAASPLTIKLWASTPTGLEGFRAANTPVPWRQVAAALRGADRWEADTRPPPIDDGAHGKRSARSILLLKDWLSPAQREQFDREGAFEVVGGETRTRYLVTDGAAPYNVLKLSPEGYVEGRLCFVPAGASAPGDVMLAQKIALETDEHAALMVANGWGTNQRL